MKRPSVSQAGPRLASTRSSRAGRPVRLFAASAGVAVVVAGVLTLLPAWLDWSRYRTAIASYATAQLGRPVRIDGPITVTLLPRPLVTAGAVRLGDRGDGITLAAPFLRLRPAFAPLLLGRLVPRELVLSGAVIGLPWPLAPAALTPNGPGWLGRSAAHVERGTITIGGLQLNDANVDLTSAGAEIGGLVIAGSARLFGQRWSFTGRLGVLDSAGAAPVEIGLDAQSDGTAGNGGRHAGGRFAGTLASDGALAGRLTAQAGDLSRLMPGPPVEARLDGTIGIGRGPATADLALFIGATAISARLQPAAGGAGEAQVLSLHTGRIDLDAWGKAFDRRAGREPRTTSRWLHLPWPVSLDFTADAMQLRGGLIRGTHGRLDLQGGRGVVRAAAATLPGEAAVAMVSGILSEQADGLSLSGQVSLDAPQLRTTLDWLRGCGLRLGAALPQTVLRTAKLTGAVQASRDRVDVSGLLGTVEDTPLSGRAGVDTGSGAIDADLSIGRLGLDNWLPVDAEAALPAWPAFSHALAGFAVNLKLHAQSVEMRGHVVDHVEMDAATSAGGVAINAAGFDVGGLHGALSGTIAADGQVADARFDLGAEHGSAFARQLPVWSRFTDYLWGGPLRLHAEATGPLDALIASLSVDLDDARLEAHPVIDLNDGSWTAQMTLRHPGASRLLGALGWPHAGDWLGEGSLSLLAQVSGGAGQLHFDSFDLTAATLHATGALKLDRRDGGSVPRLTGKVEADTLPLPPFDARAQDPIGIGALAGWSAAVDLTAAKVLIGDAEVLRSAQARLGLANGVLSLDEVQAGLAGGALTGKAALDAAALPPRVVVEGKVKGAVIGGPLFGTPVDVTAGTLDGSLSLVAEGYSAAAMVASLSGTLQARVGVGNVAGIDLKAVHAAVVAAGGGTLPAQPTLAGNAALVAALNGGGSQFDALTLAATARDGAVSFGQFGLTGPDGMVAAHGAVDLPAGTLSVLAHLPDQVDVRLTGPVGAPRRLVEPATVALSP